MSENNNIPFLNTSDFTDKVKDLFTNQKFWAPALAATLGMGAIGGISAGLSKRHKETPRQRRRRILRSILVPSLLTAGAAGLGGLGVAALNMEDFKYGDPDKAKYIDDYKKILEQRKKEDSENTKENLSTAVNVATPVAGIASGATLGYKAKNWLEALKNISYTPKAPIAKSPAIVKLEAGQQAEKILNKITDIDKKKRLSKVDPVRLLKLTKAIKKTRYGKLTKAMLDIFSNTNKGNVVALTSGGAGGYVGSEWLKDDIMNSINSESNETKIIEDLEKAYDAGKASATK